MKSNYLGTLLIVIFLTGGCKETDSGQQGSIGGPKMGVDTTSQVSEEFLDKLLNNPPNFVKNLIGKKASQINLTTLNDKPFNFEDFRGKTVVMNFWYIGCGSCMKEIPDLNKVYADSKHEKFEFVSVASNSKDELKSFFTRQDSEETKYAKMQYDIVPGEKIIAELYGVKVYPVTLILNKDGIIRYGVPYVYMPLTPELNPTYLLIKKAIDEVENADR